MPVMMPVLPTVAIMVLLLLHVPPDGDAVSIVVNPVQTVLLPDMEGVVFTINERVTYALPTV
jgi:hypothetical protein